MFGNIWYLTQVNRIEKKIFLQIFHLSMLSKFIAFEKFCRELAKLIYFKKDTAELFWLSCC